MIRYNFPERGSFEYDKLVISLLSYYNEANDLRILFEDGHFSLKTLQLNVTEALRQIREENRASQLLHYLNSTN